jgi:uncharacterized protein
MLFTEQLPIKIHDGLILLYIKVTPNASNIRVGSILNNHLKIYVTALAKNGQANKFVINLLAEKLKVSKNNISITQGLTTPNKIVSITGNADIIIKKLKIII